MDLIGLDVGFSSTRRSSGLACLVGGRYRVAHTTAQWEDRRRIIGNDIQATVAAFDAPLLHIESELRRSCERVFCFGAFQRRCKPGLSHVPGTGQRLRQAGFSSARQLQIVTVAKPLCVAFPRVTETANLVEAFPNAFLGVALPGECYDGKPTLRRGEKFDWLYDQWCARGIFREVIHRLGLPRGDEFVALCEKNKQHDQRAALVCLLTAGSVAVGQYTAVGDAEGGYFFLPHWESWEEWSRREIERQRQRLPRFDIWIAGKRYDQVEALPTCD